MKKLIIILLVFGIIFISGCTKKENKSGLIGYWKFEGNTLDYSGYGNNAVLNKNIVCSVSSISGSGCMLNGIDYINISINNSIFDFGEGAFSISFWMKTSDTSGYIFYFDSGRAVIEAVIDAGTFPGPHYFGLRTTIDDPSNWLFSPKNTVDDNWHHIVVGRNSTHRYIFIDGKFDVSDTQVSDNLYWYKNLCIGAACGGWNDLQGKIAEFMVFNRSLSEGEIQDLYKSRGFLFYFLKSLSDISKKSENNENDCLREPYNYTWSAYYYNQGSSGGHSSQLSISLEYMEGEIVSCKFLKYTEPKIVSGKLYHSGDRTGSCHGSFLKDTYLQTGKCWEVNCTNSIEYWNCSEIYFPQSESNPGGTGSRWSKSDTLPRNEDGCIMSEDGCIISN